MRDPFQAGWHKSLEDTDTRTRATATGSPATAMRDPCQAGEHGEVQASIHVHRQYMFKVHGAAVAGAGES